MDRVVVPASETSRGPRGLRIGIVQDLGRLYVLRRKVVLHGLPFVAASM